jgi:hypothetical protein
MRLFLIAALAPLAALAQSQQVVKPPIAQYWMSVETAAGFTLPGMGAMGSVMSGAMGGRGQAGRRMLLQLGSQNSASAPRAEHDIPAGLDMGPLLPLLTPERAPRAERGEESLPMERPKGRMLVYWGCGEKVRAGQPVVLDFGKIAEGEMPPNMVSHRVSAPRPPAPGRSKTYGDWPNSENSKSVPDSASLRGEHMVKGNYSPEIRFALGEAHDFMEKVALSHAGSGKVQWTSVPRATGYFATVFGAEKQDEVIFWSSSETQEMGGLLMDYVPPAEVARLVREKVVLAPSTTECIVPGEVMQKAGGSPFLNFIAYGPEANFAQPPRPSDPKIAWEPQWTAKVRLKSTAQLVLGEGGGSRRTPRAREEKSEPASSEPSRSQQPVNPVDEGVKVLKGIFGR